MDKRVEDDLHKAFASLEKGNPQEADRILGAGFMYNYESRETDVTRLYCKYWIEKMNNLLTIANPYEKGNALFNEWKNFRKFIRTKPTRFDDAIYAVKVGVFNMARELFSSLLADGDSVAQNVRADLLCKVGICLKEVGEYIKASAAFVEANAVCALDANTVALLADCHALCGHDKDAKVLFREAFYLGARNIDLDFLDSDLIKSLVRQVSLMGFSAPSFNAWCGVYGVVYGVFNIKRKLSTKEASRLKQEIYALENEQKDPRRSSEYNIPVLIYDYFRFIDYCRDQKDLQKISETLLKIKILSLEVYNEYTR